MQLSDVILGDYYVHFPCLLWYTEIILPANETWRWSQNLSSSFNLVLWCGCPVYCPRGNIVNKLLFSCFYTVLLIALLLWSSVGCDQSFMLLSSWPRLLDFWHKHFDYVFFFTSEFWEASRGYERFPRFMKYCNGCYHGKFFPSFREARRRSLQFASMIRVVPVLVWRRP